MVENPDVIIAVDGHRLEGEEFDSFRTSLTNLSDEKTNNSFPINPKELTIELNDKKLLLTISQDSRLEKFRWIEYKEYGVTLGLGFIEINKILGHP